MGRDPARAFALAVVFGIGSILASGCGNDGPPPPPPAPTGHTVSGFVGEGARVALSGVTISISGATSGTTVSTTAGTYAFTGVGDGSYTLTPSRAGFTFSPDHLDVVVSGADLPGRDFAATAIPPPTHVVSGTVSGAPPSGVDMLLAGAASASTRTSESGAYAFPGLGIGDYTITPSRAGYTFVPDRVAVSVKGEDVAGRDFTVSTRGIVEYVAGSAAKVCQLTGEEDRDSDLRLPDGSLPVTRNRTRSRFGVWGADLGFPVEHAGKLYLLFGDTQGLQATPLSPTVETEVPTVFLDSIAYTSDAMPSGCLDLDFITDPATPLPTYIPPQIDAASYPPGTNPIGHGGGRVPAAGFTANGDLHVFFVKILSGPEQRSVLARIPGADLAAGRLGAFRYLYDVSRRDPSDPATFGKGKFISVAPVEVDATALPGLRLDAGRRVLLLFGSGEYRRSDPYLAYVPIDQVDVRSAWRYLEGTDGAGWPVWGTDEAAAAPLFPAGCIGELSVSWNAFLEKWLMLYNCLGDPRGIRFQVADEPWGPWSTAMQVLFEPRQDLGYGHFMHDVGRDDVYDPWPLTAPLYPVGPSRWDEYGGEYAPYVLERYTTGEWGKSTTVHFTLSTWNPYQTVLMRSTLRVR